MNSARLLLLLGWFLWYWPAGSTPVPFRWYATEAECVVQEDRHVHAGIAVWCQAARGTPEEFSIQRRALAGRQPS